VERATASLAEVRAEAAAEARCIAGLVLGAQLPQAVQAYIKVGRRNNAMRGWGRPCTRAAVAAACCMGW
jgi:hypothetical protein